MGVHRGAEPLAMNSAGGNASRCNLLAVSRGLPDKVIPGLFKPSTDRTARSPATPCSRILAGRPLLSMSVPPSSTIISPWPDANSAGTTTSPLSETTIPVVGLTCVLETSLRTSTTDGDMGSACSAVAACARHKAISNGNTWWVRLRLIKHMEPIRIKANRAG